MKAYGIPLKSTLVTLVGTMLFFVLFWNGVDNSITKEDKLYITKFLTSIPSLEPDPSYEEQLEFISRVQDAVLTVAPINEGLPYNTEREPKDVYFATKGLCYDRSRVIEKILRYSGFDTRHLSIYSTKKSGSALKSFITPGTRSHAVTEVLTKKGWLVVDSNHRWLSIDQKGNPWSMAKIQFSLNNPEGIPWIKHPPSSIYQEPFTYIHGLYSRHGKFYPPYTLIPDVNYEELIQNFI